MSTENQPRSGKDTKLEMLLVAVGLLLAWPALIMAYVTRLIIKRTRHAHLYWLLVGGLGLAGALLLYLRANIYPLVLTESRDIAPLVFHLNGTTILRFLSDAWPVWAWSMCVFPWLALLIELLSPRSLGEHLLAQEKRRRARLARKSKRAARKVRKAPEQINGKGVLGILIENPNE